MRQRKTRLIAAARFIALLLAALSLTLESAHVLQLIPKMEYGPELYARVNATLYRNFATVGAAYQLGAIAMVLLVAVLVRRSPSFGWTLAGFGGLALAFVAWLLIVAPVNERVAAATALAPNNVVALWTTERNRWEYGHVLGFILQLSGLSCLLVSVLVDTVQRPFRPLSYDVRNLNAERSTVR